MSFVESPEQTALRAAVSELGGRYGRPYAQAKARAHEPLRELWAEAGKAGFLGVNLPVEYGLHVPPGAPNWHLPPPETKMVFIDVSPAQLCATIKDRAQTGGKDLQAMFVHNRDDKLVGWGWNPGLGRNPVPVPREEFVAAFKTWMDAGAPCPR